MVEARFLIAVSLATMLCAGCSGPGVSDQALDSAPLDVKVVRMPGSRRGTLSLSIDGATTGQGQASASDCFRVSSDAGVSVNGSASAAWMTRGSFSSGLNEGWCDAPTLVFTDDDGALDIVLSDTSATLLVALTPIVDSTSAITRCDAVECSVAIDDSSTP